MPPTTISDDPSSNKKSKERNDTNKQKGYPNEFHESQLYCKKKNFPGSKSK